MPALENLKAKIGFTPAESELADYILEHADNVTHMGIADLASAAYKSNATIIRLCRKAGSTGWRDFRVELVADLEKVRRETESIDPNTPFSSNSSTASIMSSIMKLERQAVADCYTGISREAIGKLARASTRARKVVYYALGDSYTTLYAFGGLMSKIGIDCVAADQYRFKNEAAYHTTADDIALFVSYSGSYLPDAHVQMGLLRDRHCKIAVISSDHRVLAPEAHYDFPILVPLRENKYGKVATFYSQACIRYALNCVYSVAFAESYDNNLHDKDLIEML